MEIDPKEYLDKSMEELEEICKGLTFNNLAEADENQRAALSALLIKSIAQQWKTDKTDTELISTIINILLNKDKIIKHIEDLDAFVDQHPNKTELETMPLDKVEELFAKFLLSLQNPFLPMANAPATNTFMSLRTIKPFIDPITQTTTSQEHGKIRVYINGEDKQSLVIKPSTRKLLDACTIKLTEKNHYKGTNINPVVEFPIDEYMKLCGVPLTKASKDKMRQKIKEDLETLYSISMEWEKNGAQVKEYQKTRICGSIGDIKNGIIRFTFSYDMASYLLTSYITQFPLELFRLDERNESSYNLGRKLAIHNSMDNNIRQGTANIISVIALLKECPSIPEYEKVLSEGRQIEQRIIQPFEKALDSLNNIKWEYCNSKYETLTDEQADNMDYSIFKSLYIKFEIKGAPDQKQRLEEKAAREKNNKPKRKTPKKHTVR